MLIQCIKQGRLFSRCSVIASMRHTHFTQLNIAGTSIFNYNTCVLSSEREFREAAVLSRRLMVCSDIWRDIGNLIASPYSLGKVIARYKINK